LIQTYFFIVRPDTIIEETKETNKPIFKHNTKLFIDQKIWTIKIVKNNIKAVGGKCLVKAGNQKCEQDFNFQGGDTAQCVFQSYQNFGINVDKIDHIQITLSLEEKSYEYSNPSINKEFELNVI
jgi:hypothetical protein